MIRKRVFVEISNGRFYNGTITDVNDTHIFLNDKFNQDLLILISDIKLLQPKDREIENEVTKKSRE